MTSPATTFSNSSMSTSEGCASVANAATGNLLFYTDGSTIWDQTHSIMANGSGLNAHFSSAQSSLILKKPGSPNLYYVFSQQGQNVFSGGLYYSIVDMSLSSGNGSVTVKNTSLYQPSCEKITATRHCNGIDFWIVTHDYNSAMFRSFLLTSSGISTAVVTSSAGTSASNVNLSLGVLKISPNGKKIAQSFQGNLSTGLYELYDFDNSTGIVSNAVVVNTSLHSCYSCEFSPDCTKLYGMVSGSNCGLYQWDLCAGSATAIAASMQTIFTSSSASWFIQLADDGKIYTSRAGQSNLGVINSPNSLGTACSYSANGPSFAPRTALLGLPNFILSFVKPSPPLFTYTVSPLFGCQTASFTAPAVVQTYTTIGCVSSGYSVTGYSWNFGDPGSGSANTSTLANPSHAFSTLGTYSTQLIIYYSCGGGTDTLTQMVNVSQPCASVTSASISCSGLGSATVISVGSGPFSYTWLPSAQNGSVASNLSPGTYTIIIYNAGINVTSSITSVLTSSIPLLGTLNHSDSLTCNSAATGTANFTGITGGSANQNYVWTNGISTYTTAYVNVLGAGGWSVTVTDALTGCQMHQSFSISAPPSFSLALSFNKPGACLGDSIILTGSGAGGIPGYTYSWTAGPVGNTRVISQSMAGTYVYTLVGADSHSCLTSNTIAVSFVSNPILSVPNVSICPSETGTLIATGASSYTWNNTWTSTTFAASPSIATQYTVIGSAFGCTSTATANIFIKPAPFPFAISNSPVCEGKNLNLQVYGGASYNWNGPNNFISSSQFPVIGSVGLNGSGVYHVVVTAANSCTASAAATVIVNPTPTLAAAGSTVCTSQTLTLSASSNGMSYLWNGPNGFTSTNQNNNITNPLLTQSGSYTVKVSSAQACTTSAVAVVSVISPPLLNTVLSNNGTLCAQALSGSSNTVVLVSSGANSYTLQTPPDISNTQLSASAFLLSPLAPYNAGIFTATLVGSNGVCPATTTVNFFVIPNPSVVVSSPAATICPGQTYTLTSTGANSYTWLWGLSAGHGSLVIATSSATTVYSVVGESQGCMSGIQVSTITVNPFPIINITPEAPLVCPGAKLDLTASGTSKTYTWYPNSANGASISVFPTILQSYTVVGELNACTNSAVVTVSLLPLPQPTANILKSSICLNEVVTLSGLGGNTYQWQGPDNLMYSGQTVTFAATSLLFSGIYTLTVADDNNCKNSANTQLTIFNLPGGYLSGSRMQGCVPFHSDFKFHPLPENALVSISWEMDKTVFSTNNFSYDFKTAGNYVITGKIKDNNTACINTETFVVEVYPIPVADFTFSPSNPVENLDQIFFENTSIGEEQKKWNWFFVNNAGYRSKTENTSYFFTDAGVYPVVLVVSNKWGCADTVVKAVKVNPDFTIYVPNVFTPNEDELNETFLPVLRGTKLYTMKIYDRWGAKLFETNNSTIGWDGSYKGEPCKEDIYIWKINLSTIAGESREMTGHVMLNR
jgi:gliding motility-associated-like protein